MRHVQRIIDTPRYRVSIHAPTRGATHQIPTSLPGVVVSIHAPTRGATDRGSLDYNVEEVSIHAPTRGATVNLAQIEPNNKGFNPRTHTGCDYKHKSTSSISKGFNPRTHTGCDSAKSFAVIFSGCFNPRTHTGCDDVGGLTLRPLLVVSIHAPTRGATSGATGTMHADMFQSTHPHGVRLSFINC